MIRTWLVTIGDAPAGNVVVAEVDPEAAAIVARIASGTQVAVDGLPSRDIAAAAAGALAVLLPPDWGGGRS